MREIESSWRPRYYPMQLDQMPWRERREREIEHMTDHIRLEKRPTVFVVMRVTWHTIYTWYVRIIACGGKLRQLRRPILSSPKYFTWIIQVNIWKHVLWIHRTNIVGPLSYSSKQNIHELIYIYTHKTKWAFCHWVLFLWQSIMRNTSVIRPSLVVENEMSCCSDMPSHESVFVGEFSFYNES